MAERKTGMPPMVAERPAMPPPPPPSPSGPAKYKVKTSIVYSDAEGGRAEARPGDVVELVQSEADSFVSLGAVERV